MSFMPWNDGFIIGIAQIDEQHHWLVDMTNVLHDSLHGLDDQAPPLGDLLESLVDYTMNHFVLEEELFQRLGYPEESTHKAEHNGFSAQIVNLLLRHEQGESVNMDTLELLKNWLTHHILKVDKAYVSFFKSQGIA